MQGKTLRSRSWIAARTLALTGIPLAPPTWDEVAWLKAPAAMMPLGIGAEVAAGPAGTIVVGGGRDDDTGVDAAAVAVWECSDRGGSVPSVIHHPHGDRNAWFGGALALDAAGSLLAIGAPHEMGARERSQGGWPGGFQAGSVHLYQRVLPREGSGGRSGWEAVALLRSKDSRSGATFGAAVAIDGTRLLVGSPGHSGGGFAAGLAEAFVAGPDGWRHEAALMPPSWSMGARAGTAVALAGTTAVVGAPGIGCVDIYRCGKDGWSHAARVHSPNAQPGGAFGIAVALDGGGDILAVGAPLESGSSGAVHMFRCIDRGLPSEHWNHTSTTPAPAPLCPDATPYPEAFGMSLAMSCGLLIAGASESCSGTGTAYAFRTEPGGTLAGGVQLTPSHAMPECHDGYRVALGALGPGRPMVVVGRLGNSDLAPGPGGATVFVRQDPIAVASGP